MENKKIVDYILVNGDNDTSSLSLNLRELRRKITPIDRKVYNLTKRKKDGENVDFWRTFLDITIKKHDNIALIKEEQVFLNSCNTTKSDVEHHATAKYVSEYSIEEIETILKTTIKESKELDTINKELLLAEEQQQKEQDALFNLEGDTLSKLEKCTLEVYVVKLLKVGYVPLGGVSVSQGIPYQAMVKYEA